MSKYYCETIFRAVASVSLIESGQIDSHPESVQKRMYDFFDQTSDFLLVMQNLLKDFKPGNAGIGIHNDFESLKLESR